MKRLICSQCKRPANACICGWVTPIKNFHQVLILQHPLEVNNAKGSAMLLALSLAKCRVVIGEAFDPLTLKGLLYAPWLDADPQESVTPLLLYPEAPVGRPTITTTPLRFIVIDATWRKSRKMLYLNPLLATLPRFSLTTLQASRYLVRKAQRPEQRSTLEATCSALAELEGNANARYDPLLLAFDGFVDAIAARTNKQ
jgi:DTW domain-containing protein